MKKIALLVAIFVFTAQIASAYDFGTAMAITTTNVPAGADIASMGNADASAWSFSSNNPALAAYDTPENKSQFGVSATFGLLNFKNGPSVRFTSESASVKTPIGYFGTTISYFNSDKANTKMGVEAEFCPSKNLELVWANKIVSDWLKKGDELYLGLEVSYSKSKLNFSLPEYGRILRSESVGNDLMIGFLYKPTTKLNVGGYYGRFFECSREKDFVYKTSVSSTSISHQFKLGASYQVLPMTFAAVDVQLLNIAGQKKTQIFAGVEQGIIKDFLYLYAGMAHKSPTCGLGMYFDRGGLNLSYSSNATADTNKYLGKSKLIMAQIFFSF